jgi:hypothetical protein
MKRNNAEHREQCRTVEQDKIEDSQAKTEQKQTKKQKQKIQKQKQDETHDKKKNRELEEKRRASPPPHVAFFWHVFFVFGAHFAFAIGFVARCVAKARIAFMVFLQPPHIFTKPWARLQLQTNVDKIVM